MKIATYVIAVIAVSAVTVLGVSTLSAGSAFARGSTIHAKCHWYKQQAFKLKTDAAWTTYRQCLRGRL